MIIFHDLSADSKKIVENTFNILYISWNIITVCTIVPKIA